MPVVVETQKMFALILVLIFIIKLAISVIRVVKLFLSASLRTNERKNFADAFGKWAGKIFNLYL